MNSTSVICNKQYGDLVPFLEGHAEHTQMEGLDFGLSGMEPGAGLGDLVGLTQLGIFYNPSHLLHTLPLHSPTKTG